MAVALLKYANRAKVAKALTVAGYPVTRMTVNRWAAGGEMPPIAARMILELFRHDTTKEALAPQWAQGLESRLTLEVQINRALIEANPAEVAELEQRLGALRQSPQPPVEEPQTVIPRILWMGDEVDGHEMPHLASDLLGIHGHDSPSTTSRTAQSRYVGSDRSSVI